MGETAETSSVRRARDDLVEVNIHSAVLRQPNRQGDVCVVKRLSCYIFKVISVRLSVESAIDC